MGVYEQAWAGSAEMRSLASKEQVKFWEDNPKQLLTQPDLAKKIMGIMLRLTITPEVIQSRAHNFLEDAGIIKEISEPIGRYKQHILMSLPQASDPQFLDLQNKTSVDQQKIWLTEDKEYFQNLVNIAIQIPLTITETEYRQAFATAEAMQQVLAAKRNGISTAYRLNMLYNEMDAIHQVLTAPQPALKTSQTITLTSEFTDYEFTEAAYKEMLKVISAMKFNFTHYFTGKYNQAGFPTMKDSDGLVMLVRPEFKRNIGIDLLYSAFNKDELGADIKMVEVPNFGGLAGFTPTYNDNGQQTTSPAETDTITDPHKDVLAIITTNNYFVKNTISPFAIESAPYNARGKYISMYGNYLGGITAIGYEPFIVIKKKSTE